MPNDHAAIPTFRVSVSDDDTIAVEEFDLRGSIAIELANEDRIAGHARPEHLQGWFNWLSVRVDDDGEVILKLSAGDPRGAFVITMRRREDGRIVITTPHPDDTCPHMRVEPIGRAVVTVEAVSAGEPHPDDVIDTPADYV